MARNKVLRPSVRYPTALQKSGHGVREWCRCVGDHPNTQHRQRQIQRLVGSECFILVAQKSPHSGKFNAGDCQIDDREQQPRKIARDQETAAKVIIEFLKDLLKHCRPASGLLENAAFMQGTHAAIGPVIGFTVTFMADGTPVSGSYHDEVADIAGDH